MVGDKEKELKQYGDTHKADTLEDMEVVREVMRKRRKPIRSAASAWDVLFRGRMLPEGIRERGAGRPADYGLF